MLIADKWQDYELLDASNGERLERWGKYILIRPDPQVIWKGLADHPAWEKADASYIRSSKGGGKWHGGNALPEEWRINYGKLKFVVKPMGFKHTGVFPEQAVNWDRCGRLISESGRKIKVLNLFAYTGGATVACAAAGASVCHVDAAKGMVAQAKQNAAESGLAEAPVRYIVDDCRKFVEREIRRGNKYDAIIMDPPSYGRGPSGEIWKLEDNISGFVFLVSKLLSDNPLFFLINSYTTGLSPSAMGYILSAAVKKKYGGRVEADEIGIPVTQTGEVLPCGSSAFWTK